MTDHALEVLEFERVLDRIAARASSEAGRRRIRELRPMLDVAGVSAELERVAATMRIVEAAPQWAPGVIPGLEATLPQLHVEGAVLDPMGIHRIGQLLSTCEALERRLEVTEADLSPLASIRARLVYDRQLVERIERSVDDEGMVLSSASAELRRIRDRLRGAQNRIVKRLERFMATLPDRFLVPDASVTIRDGRFVVPVRREGKSEVGGIIHDESQTGATLYMEPPVAIEATNQLRELEREESREIRRVLGALTETLAPRSDELRGAYDAVADFDGLFARARTAVTWGSTPPRVEAAAPAALELREARHPLLLETSDDPVVPYDLVLDASERCLVVSGPNTGGKSVFLKATGLIGALAQAGVVPPVGPGTRLPVFGSFFADIGDEQSIARNLSTFSAHLENLRTLVEAADQASLILIDEMGTGTDPAEGAALSRAVLEELVSRGATTIVSSHLGELKHLDAEGSGIVNASLQFDAERMEPTYRLIKGRPGRSYGLAIARRLGFPAPILDRAESHRDQGAARLEDVLERLEERELEVERLIEELDVERRRALDLRTDVESREQTLQVAERTADDRARADARRLLMEARREVDAAITDLRVAAEEGADLDAAAREARQRVEQAAARQSEQSGRSASPKRKTSKGVPKRGKGRRSNAAATDPSVDDPGAYVRIRATGARGRILEQRGARVLVEVGALRFEVPAEDLESVDPPAKPRASEQAGSWRATSAAQARVEVDLRGLRVDEMQLELKRALDQAMLDELAQLRIIHGMGTGALRKRVTELLRMDGRVRDFRLGGPGEGGAGVTVAIFGGRG